MRQLKVLVISSNYPDETDVTRQNHVHNQLLHYGEIAVRPTVLDLSPSRPGIRTEIFQGIEIFRLGVLPKGLKRSLVFRWLYTWQLRKLLNSILPQFDLIHVHALCLELPPVIDLLRRKPLIVTCHGDDVYPSRLRRLEKKRRTVLQNADLLTGVSEYTVGLISNYVADRTKLHFVPNGIVEERFRAVNRRSQAEARAELGLPLGRKIILMACVLVERKGVLEVLRAFKETRDAVPEAYLVVIGKGVKRQEMQDYIRKHKLESDVVMIDYVKEDLQMALYYRASDLYIMFSKTVKHKFGAGVEGFGISYIDASATGIPVIGGKSGGVESAVIDGKTGFLVDPVAADAIEQLHRRMVELLSDDALRRQLGRAGQERAFRDLTWSTNVKRMRELYDMLLQSKTRAGEACPS